jgi:hypothetical protein
VLEKYEVQAAEDEAALLDDLDAEWAQFQARGPGGVVGALGPACANCLALWL